MYDNSIPFPMRKESSDDFTLVRKIDRSYLPNKILFIVLAFLFPLFVGWFFYSGQSLIQSVISSVLQVSLVFLCWAIGRELDPDNDYAAFFGLPLLFIPFTINQGNIFVLFWFLIGLRLITQTTGKQATSTDIIFYVFLTLISILFSSAIMLIPLAIVFIFLSSFLPKKQISLSFLSIPLFPGFVLFLLIKSFSWSFLNPSPLILIYIAVSSGLLFLVVTTTEELKSTGDFSYSQLTLKRIQSAQLLCVLSVLIISTFHGNILPIFPVWAAITGIGVYRLIKLIVKY